MQNQQVFFRKGKKVLLRPVLQEDVHQLFIWMNNPEITQYLLRREPVSLEKEQEWFERITKNDKSDRYTFAIVEIESNKLLGTIGIHGIEPVHGTATTGTFIGEEENRSKGYGTEAKMLLLQFAFNDLNLRQIYSRVFDFNQRSFKYSSKCGYKQVARIPKRYYKGGKYVDELILCVNKKNWQKVAREFFK